MSTAVRNMTINVTTRSRATHTVYYEPLLISNLHLRMDTADLIPPGLQHKQKSIIRGTFSALESGRPDFRKIRSTPFLGPPISNRGPKKKLKERKRHHGHHTTRQQTKSKTTDDGVSLCRRGFRLATSFASASIAAAISRTSSP